MSAIDDLKKKIDAMTQFELCRRWRYSKSGDPFFQGEVGEYFAKKLRGAGGFTPEISKQLGWDG